MGIIWSDIQQHFDPDPAVHWQRCAAEGLSCPFDVFEQLFHEHHDDEAFALGLTWVDWSRVAWVEESLTGVRLRQVAAPRGYQYAVDEARARTVEFGLQDAREDVRASWRDAKTWVRSPVVVDGEALANLYRYEILVGFTRLGDLLGLMDRREVSETAVHRVWVGSVQAK